MRSKTTKGLEKKPIGRLKWFLSIMGVMIIYIILMYGSYILIGKESLINTVVGIAFSFLFVMVECFIWVYPIIHGFKKKKKFRKQKK